MKLESGEIIKAKQIVVACGPRTNEMYEKPDLFEMKKLPMETYVIDNHKYLPPTLILDDIPELNGYHLFSCLDGDNLQHYKFGYEMGAIDNSHALQVIYKVFPSKYHDIIHVQPCMYDMTTNEEFIFERKRKTVYAFGTNGRGFKFFPYHGKRVHQIVSGKI